MAAPSEKVTFKSYGVQPKCYGCGRRLLLADARWFVGIPRRAVYGDCCFPQGAKI